MSWASDTKLRLQFFAILLTFMCPAFLIWQAPGTIRQFASTGWPSVTGEVLGVNVKVWVDDEKKVKFFGRVKYRYVVEGKEYVSDLTDLGPGSKRANREAALADVSDYTPGMKVPVYYDPNDPEVGIIQKGIPPIHLALFIGFILGTVVGAFVTFFTVRAWIRSSRQKAAEAKL